MKNLIRKAALNTYRYNEDMSYYLVCPIKVIGGTKELLTYESEQPLAIGQVVEIPYGKKAVEGVVWEEVPRPEFALKKITAQREELLTGSLMKLASWISQYYAARLPVVLQTMLPAGMGKKRRNLKFDSVEKTRRETTQKLSPAQAKAIQTIEQSASITHLLHGVTGSGKTRVYQELAKKVLSRNKSVLILVPEISLTPQLSDEFQHLSVEVIVLHSQLTEAQRHIHWKYIKNSEEPLVIIGPRSALFAPLNAIGLIVVDECHEPSFIQDSHPKYHALRVARKLAELHKGCKLVLGSATPSITDFYYASKTNAPLISLPNPVVKRNRAVVVIDSKKRENFTKHPLLSNSLLSEIEKSLKSSHQILLYHNRRGTARIALCGSCGWIAECPNCLIPLRLHHDRHQLECHVCTYHEPLKSSCPECKNPDVEFKGFGSKRIEQEVKKLFPKAKVARFDSDTPLSEQLHKRYDELYNNKIDIIIGTQGLAKGLDLPKLRTIGIIQTDTELFIPDFSSNERAFQLITQVIGRAGRTGDEAVAIIQTLNPENATLQTAINENYREFYNEEIENRRAAHLPPFTFLLQLQIGYNTEKTAETAAQEMAKKIKMRHPKVTIHGPTPTFYAYRGGKHYYQLVIKAQSRALLVEIASNLPSRWIHTLDPINLL